MAKHDHTSFKFRDQSDFVLNGATPLDRPDPELLFSQAAAVLSFVTVSADEAGGIDKLCQNNDIILMALEGAQTLLALGMFHHQREGFEAVHRRAISQSRA